MSYDFVEGSSQAYSSFGRNISSPKSGHGPSGHDGKTGQFGSGGNSSRMQGAVRANSLQGQSELEDIEHRVFDGTLKCVYGLLWQHPPTTKIVNDIIRSMKNVEAVNNPELLEDILIMLAHICEYFFGNNRKWEGALRTLSNRQEATLFKKEVWTVQLPLAYYLVSPIDMETNRPSLLYKLLFDHAASQVEQSLIYYRKENLPDPVVQWIHGTLDSMDSDATSPHHEPPFVRNWLYTLQQDLEYDNSSYRSPANNSRFEQLPLNPKEFLVISFLRSPDLVSKRPDKPQTQSQTTKSSAWSSPFGKSGSADRLGDQRRKLHKNLLLHGFVEYRLLEPYCELLFQYLKVMLSADDENYSSFFIDAIILCWFWPCKTLSSERWHFTPELGTAIMTFLVYILYHDREDLKNFGTSDKLDQLRPHLFNFLKTSISSGYISSKSSTSFEMAVDIWLMYLMPWQAKKNYCHTPRRFDAPIKFGRQEGHHRGPLDNEKPYKFEVESWGSYVYRNLKFYDDIFELFLHIRHEQLEADNGRLEIVERVLYFFTPELRRCIKECKEEANIDPYSENMSCLFSDEMKHDRESLWFLTKDSLLAAQLAAKSSTSFNRAGSATTITYVDDEHLPQWNNVGKLTDIGRRQVRDGTRTGSTLRWMEKNQAFVWKNPESCVVIDPLEYPRYSYEIPILTNILIMLSRQLNTLLGFPEGSIDYGPQKDDVDHFTNSSQSNSVSSGNSDENPQVAVAEEDLPKDTEEDKNNLWNTDHPTYSYYLIAMKGESFVTSKSRSWAARNKEDRIRRLLRMSHVILDMDGDMPAPIKADAVLAAAPAEATSVESNSKKRKRKKRKKGSCDPRDIVFVPKYPRLKFRINLRFLADVRGFILFSLIYVICFYVPSFFTSEEKAKHVSPNAEQMRIGNDRGFEDKLGL